MDAISRRNVLVAAPSWREIEHVTPAHHPLLSTSQRGSAARTRPCNIWREDEEGWGAVIQPGDFLKQKKDVYSAFYTLEHSLGCPRGSVLAVAPQRAAGATSSLALGAASGKLQPSLHMKFPRTRRSWQTTWRIRWFPKEHEKHCRRLYRCPFRWGD